MRTSGADQRSTRCCRRRGRQKTVRTLPTVRRHFDTASRAAASGGRVYAMRDRRTVTARPPHRTVMMTPGCVTTAKAQLRSRGIGCSAPRIQFLVSAAPHATGDPALREGGGGGDKTVICARWNGGASPCHYPAQRRKRKPAGWRAGASRSNSKAAQGPARASQDAAAGRTLNVSSRVYSKRGRSDSPRRGSNHSSSQRSGTPAGRRSLGVAGGASLAEMIDV